MILRLLRLSYPWKVILPALACVEAPMIVAANRLSALPMASGETPLLLRAIVASVWVPIVLMAIGLGRPTLRATPFEAGLPISGRQLLAARSVGRLGLLWGPVLAMLVAARVGGKSAMASDLLAGSLIATVGILLPQSIRGADLTASKGLLAIVWIGLAGAGALVWYLAPAPVTLAILAAGIVAAAIRLWSSAPASFQTAPVDVQGSAPPTAFRRTHAARAATRSPWRPLVPSGIVVTALLACGFMAMTGLAGGFDVVVYVVLFGSGAVAAVRRRLQWMSGLPVSIPARTWIILLTTVVPGLVGLTVGFAIRRGIMWDTVGVALDSGPHRLGDHTYYPGNTRHTNVGLDLWRVAPGGRAPVVRSPSGETFVPPTISILGLDLYNPYYVGPTTSDAVLAWQFERATTAVYGRPIPYAERDSVASGPPIVEQPRMLVLTVAAVAVFMFYGLFVIELSRWHRLLAPSARWLRGIVVGAAGAPLAVLLVADFWFQMTESTSLTVPLTHAVLRLVSHGLPQNLAAVVVASALPVILMYWLVASQARRSESPKPWQTRGAT